MFLTFLFIDQALALKFRILSIQFTSERLSMADVGIELHAKPGTHKEKRDRGPTRRCVGSTRHISIRARPVGWVRSIYSDRNETPSAGSTLGVVRPHFGLLW
jgi:hypothetical protein